MSRTAFKLTSGFVFSLLLSAAAYAQSAPEPWSTQNATGCSDQYGSFDAFIPGMRGFGTCNRGGFVPNTTVHVIDNASELSSFLAAACPKVGLFGTSGRYMINASVTNDCTGWSLVGASAPGQVVISGTGGNPQIETKGDNYTIDHLVIAPGDEGITSGGLGNRDALDLHYGPPGSGTAGGNNVVLLNNAFIWGTDETVTCYSTEPMTNVTYWQNIVGVGLVGNHNLNHLISGNCVRHSLLRQVTVHSDGRNPLVRADDFIMANSYVFNPGFQSVLMQPCEDSGVVPTETNLISNLMVRGPNTNSHEFFMQQTTSCVGGSTIYESGNAVMNGVSRAVENCAGHGCFSGTAPTWAGSPIGNAMPAGYVPESIGTPTDSADLLAFGQKLIAYVGPRPNERMAYLQTLMGEATNGLDGSGSLGSFACPVTAAAGSCTGSATEGGISQITPATATYNPTSAADNPCQEAMPTGAAANAITTSGRTRLHEWVIGCFYDDVMPGGYREDALQYYPAPDGPPPVEPVARPNPPAILQVS